VGLIAVMSITASLALAAPQRNGKQREVFGTQLNEKVRKELVTLPYYGVFDNLAFKVDGSTVTLYGHVTRPTTRSDAQRRVQRINGVGRVINEIEVLPLSRFDDQIRARVYRSVFSKGGLHRYARGANPSIHIIVKNGRVTLEGVVSNEADSRLAYIAANSVPGVFSVTNNLRTNSRT
jgi:hyperosmotically inducible protein